MEGEQYMAALFLLLLRFALPAKGGFHTLGVLLVFQLALQKGGKRDFRFYKFVILEKKLTLGVHRGHTFLPLQTKTKI